LSYNKTVVPEGNLTTVNVEYKKMDNGVYIIYEDSSLQSVDEYKNSGYKPLENKTPKGALVVSENA